MFDSAMAGLCGTWARGWRDRAQADGAPGQRNSELCRPGRQRRHAPGSFGSMVLWLDGEHVTAGRVQAQPDGLAPGRPHIGEDAGEPGVPVAELDVEVAAVLELEEEQAARASAHAPASPAMRRIWRRRWVRIMRPSVNGPGVRRLSGS